MKFDGGGQESGGDFLVEFQGGFDDVDAVALDHRVEVAHVQMRREDARVDRLQGVEIREGNGENREVTLKSVVDQEEWERRRKGGGRWRP